MTDNEKRAHDIALAITSIAFKSSYDAELHTGIANKQERVDIHVSSKEFFERYQQIYADTLSRLNDQK